jgi:hypothetical protein
MCDQDNGARITSHFQNSIYVEKIEDSKAAEWLANRNFVKFIEPRILRVFWQGDVDWWVARKGESPICVWPICIEGRRGLRPELTYWIGPVWLRNISGTSSLSLRSRVYRAFLDKFSENYDEIEFELCPEELDVRIFDWYGNHEEHADVKILPRYTARIDLKNVESIEQLMPKFSTLRRRESRKLAEVNRTWKITSEFETSNAITLYSTTLSRQGIELRSSLEESIIGFTSLKNKDDTSFICAQDSDTNAIIGLVGLLTNNYSANLVLNLMSEDARSEMIMTDLINLAISESINKGICYFDFNGANSPNRAQHKHSFAAPEALYFYIKIKW